MDQSASVLGLEGNVLYITFKPALDAKAVSFPKSTPALTFVIAKSFVQADKHTTGPVNYNLRVVESTLAAQVLAKKHGLTLPEDNGPLGSTLRGFQDTYFAQESKSSTHEEQLKKCIELVKTDLSKEEGYTREEITEILGISLEQLTKQYMTRFPSKYSQTIAISLQYLLILPPNSSCRKVQITRQSSSRFHRNTQSL